MAAERGARTERIEADDDRLGELTGSARYHIHEARCADLASSQYYHHLKFCLEDLVCIIHIGIARGWADHTHFAFLMFARCYDGTGLLQLRRGEVLVICSERRIRLFVYPSNVASHTGLPRGDAIDLMNLKQTMAILNTGDRSNNSIINDDLLCRVVRGAKSKTTVDWLEVLLDALEANWSLVAVVATVLPVAYVPELVASYGYVSGIDALRERFHTPRKRMADTPLVRMLMKKSKS